MMAPMVRKVAFCVGCLAMRGLAFAPPLRPSPAVSSRDRLGCRKGLFHAGRSHHAIPAVAAAAYARNNGGRVPRCRAGAAGEEEEEEDSQDILLLNEAAPPPPVSEHESAAAGKVVSAGSLFKEPPPAQRPTRTRMLLTGVVLACAALLSSPLATTRPALAESSLQQQQQQAQPQQEQQQPQQQHQLFGMVAPRPAQRPRPPPPEIPPGRITLVQWYAKNVGRYVPTFRDVTSGVKTAAETAEKIRFKSGSSPTTQDLRRMAGTAVKDKLGGLVAARGPSSSAPAQEIGVTTDTSSALLPSETSTYRQEIDALKAEMLRLQPASPSTVGVTASETAAAAAAGSRGDSRGSSSFSAGEPSTTPAWLVKLGMRPMPTTETGAGDRTKSLLVAAQTQQGTTTGELPAAVDAETPRTKGKKREKPRRKAPVPAAVVDLKAELRAESEKVARTPSPTSQPPSPPPRTKKQDPAASENAATVKYVAPAPLYEPSKELTGDASGEGAGGTLTAGLGDVTAAARASLEKLDLSGVSGQVQDLTEQMKDLADKGGSVSEAGVATAFEQGRATVDRLQAKANRLSAEVGGTAVPIADKLSAGVSNLPGVSLSAGSSAGTRLSQLSGSLTARLSASVRGAAVQMGTVRDSVKGVTADLGSTAAGTLAEALGRGADKVLPAFGGAGRAVRDGASTLSKAAAGGLPVVQEQTSALSSQIGSAVDGAGKTLNEGVSKLSKNAAEGLPAVQDQVSVLTSQVAEKSSQAVSQVSDGAGKISGRIAGGLSGLSGRAPDLTAQAKGTLGQLSKLGGGFADGALDAARDALSTVRGISPGSSFFDGQGGGTGDVEAGTAAAAAAVVVAAGAAAVGRGGGGGGKAGGREGAEVASAGGNAGERATGEEEGRLLLQAIGGSAGGGGVVVEGEEQLLQPVGVKLETGAANGGERFGEEALSGSSTLWDMIRESGTGAGDAVREVSEEDLLARAAVVGGQLRETAEGLEVLKHEVFALRESIRESDLEGKARAIQERLASVLEENIVN